MRYHFGVMRNGKILWAVESLDIEGTSQCGREHTTACSG